VGKATPRTAVPSPPTALAYGRFEMLLAACWLGVPALQYLITVQLTSARLGSDTCLFAFAWPVVSVYGDFTSVYLVLLAATVGVAVLRVLGCTGSRP
jgi:hypothetical protein